MSGSAAEALTQALINNTSITAVSFMNHRISNGDVKRHVLPLLAANPRLEVLS